VDAARLEAAHQERRFQNQCTLDRVLQLAEVAWLIMSEREGLGFLRGPFDPSSELACMFTHEVVGQWQDIPYPLEQWRYCDGPGPLFRMADWNFNCSSRWRQ
jgi:hypothetical protein